MKPVLGWARRRAQGEREWMRAGNQIRSIGADSGAGAPAGVSLSLQQHTRSPFRPCSFSDPVDYEPASARLLSPALACFAVIYLSACWVPRIPNVTEPAR